MATKFSDRQTDLANIPLWRLLVALHDTERASGPTSEITRALVRIVQDRLRGEDGPGAGQEVANASC